MFTDIAMGIILVSIVIAFWSVIILTSKCVKHVMKNVGTSAANASNALIPLSLMASAKSVETYSKWSAKHKTSSKVAEEELNALLSDLGIKSVPQQSTTESTQTN